MIYYTITLHHTQQTKITLYDTPCPKTPKTKNILTQGGCFFTAYQK
jgi:hypothetical protein